jgi:dinuclear metal center YbgI/SA1388 family protein
MHYLRKKILFIVLICVLCGVGGFVTTRYLIAPQYTASTRVYVLNRSNENMVVYSDYQISTQMLSDYKVLITGRNVTQEVVEEAAAKGCELIVAHHPVIFEPVRSLTDRDPTGKALLTMAEQGIAAICAHTNLDAAVGGVNDALAAALGLEEVTPLGLPYEPTPAMGRMGKLSHPMNADDFARYVCERLGTHVKYSDSQKEEVHTVALCGGAGADFIEPAMAAGADALVTSEVKHHQWLAVQGKELIFVDAGHFETEQVIVSPLAETLKQQLELPVTVIPQKSPVRYC